MNKLTLSYETTLPSHLYLYLRRLFSIQRFYINKLIREYCLNIFESRGKPEGLDSEGVRQREPLRLTLRLQVEAVSKSRLLAWL